MKFNVGPIVKDHYATLRNARSGKVRPLDYIQFGGLPLVVGVLVGLKNVRLHRERQRWAPYGDRPVDCFLVSSDAAGDATRT